MKSDKIIEKTKIEIAAEELKQIKKYYTHLFIFGIALALYVLKKYFGISFNFFPLRWLNQFVISCWAFLIFIKTLKMVFMNKIFNSTWERNKINEILEKGNQSKTRWE
ncbi:hypothetical protein FLACOL_02157 [Flavobacterium columnare]|uniref:2TM domain-containing protein n=2 Tax=Flavobacterium TaxID=237 RepID=A0A2N9PCQ1_9FLAO|nr:MULTISPECIES: 2TM domain-containing protein [Flavobacterium]QYS88781.1 2TM domain-containing protein [Flavobacterium davisii]RVU89966.1 hypothetical protein EH230_03090 [Flavobacterium columnare]SPE78142.1 hypothetical protein FLACOL_02157 [Flavobacterium columnare]